MTFTIAILGRPNVGKSTLFNRLTGKRQALVDDRPGVTRDRRTGMGRLGGEDFKLVDTAGLDDAPGDQLLGAMQVQTNLAVAEADLLLFLLDARAGVTPADQHFANLLRKSGKPVILAANKCEGEAAKAGLLEAFQLGLGEPVAISAEHGLGLSELHGALVPWFPAQDDGPAGSGSLPEAENKPLSLAIVGRPNAGKSTLINHLLGAERMLAGPQAGMTRDAIALEWAWQGRDIKLVDTAGLRKRARVTEKLEKLAVADALRAVRFAEVVVLLIDAQRPFDKQDLQIADHVVEEGRALVIAVNKWDLVSDKNARKSELREIAQRLLPQVKKIPLVFLSALSGTGTGSLMPAVLKVYDAWNLRISTAALNRWLPATVARHVPPAVRGRPIRMRYMTQSNTRPPTFILFCSMPERLPKSYSRYLINELGETFKISSVPVRLHLRRGKNPYAAKKK